MTQTMEIITKLFRKHTFFPWSIMTGWSHRCRYASFFETLLPTTARYSGGMKLSHTLSQLVADQKTELTEDNIPTSRGLVRANALARNPSGIEPKKSLVFSSMLYKLHTISLDFGGGSGYNLSTSVCLICGCINKC